MSAVEVSGTLHPGGYPHRYPHYTGSRSPELYGGDERCDSAHTWPLPPPVTAPIVKIPQNELNNG